MRDTVYLKLNPKGVTGTTKNKPHLKAGEFAVKLDVRVDDKFFRHSIPRATLDIGGEFLIHPEIEVEPERPDDVMGTELGPM